jgi:amino acid transporter
MSTSLSIAVAPLPFAAGVGLLLSAAFVLNLRAWTKQPNWSSVAANAIIAFGALVAPIPGVLWAFAGFGWATIGLAWFTFLSVRRAKKSS